MKYLTYIFLISLLIPTYSFASYTYVKVANTTKADKLKKIKYTLNRLGQRTTQKTIKNKNFVYSGPYSSVRSARNALKKIKRYFPYAKVIKTKHRITNKKKVKVVQKKVVSNNKGYFLSAALGYSSASLTYKGSSTITDTDNNELKIPGDSGISYDISGGYHIDENSFMTIGILRSDLKDIVFDNIYASLNYKCDNYGDYLPYLGGIAGYSKLTWNQDPIVPSDNTINESDSFFAGTQAGVVYGGYEKVSLYFNYQCLFMNHSTTINVDPDSTKLQHNTLHNIQFGIRYSL